MYYHNFTNDPQQDWDSEVFIEPSNLSLIDNIELDGIDTRDYPDFSDAFILAADYDGVEMTEEQLDWVADNCPEFINDAVLNHFL